MVLVRRAGFNPGKEVQHLSQKDARKALEKTNQVPVTSVNKFDCLDKGGDRSKYDQNLSGRAISVYLYVRNTKRRRHLTIGKHEIGGKCGSDCPRDVQVDEQ